MDDEKPSDEMRGRASGGRLKLWLLLQADRWAVATIVLGVVFTSLVILGSLDPSPLRKLAQSKDPFETTFQALLSAIITGVTLVVTINQLVLSQELGAVGDQRDRMDSALDFRENVEDTLDVAVSPPDPATFLKALVDNSAARADDLAEASHDAPDDVQSQVQELIDAIQANADEVSDQLDGARFGSYAVLSAALNYNYSWKLYQARRFTNEYGDKLSEEANTVLEDIENTLALFGPAREHIKTLYFQWELIDLSRAMLYASVPAIIVTVSGISYVDAGAISGSLLGIDLLIWVMSGMTVVALLPFVVLLAYVLRIATVTKRTLAIGPFILRDTDRAAESDWDDPWD